MAILEALLSGGLTGLVGTVVQRVADHQTKKLELQAGRERYAHEVEMRKADAAIMAQEWAARTRVAEVESAGKEAAADAEAFAASFKEPPRYSDGVKATVGQGWMLVLLDLFRGLVRPALTVYLCAVTTLIYLQARQAVGDADPAQQLAVLERVVDMILYITTCCTLWWFGSRPPKKKA